MPKFIPAVYAPVCTSLFSTSCTCIVFVLFWFLYSCFIVHLCILYHWQVSNDFNKDIYIYILQWSHNEHDGVSNHQPHDGLLSRLFMRRSKKTSKLDVTGLCEGNSPVTGEFPELRVSNAENFSIWWRHHEDCVYSQRRVHTLWWLLRGSPVRYHTKQERDDTITRCRNSKCLRANPNQYLINRNCRLDYPVTLFSLPLHANVALLSSPYQSQRLTAISLPYEQSTDKMYWQRRIIRNITINEMTYWYLMTINNLKIFGLNSMLNNS